MVGNELGCILSFDFLPIFTHVDRYEFMWVRDNLALAHYQVLV